MIRKKGNLIILAFSVIVVSFLIFPVSAGLVTINNSVHLNYSITGGPLYMNSQNSSVEVSTTNYYGSHLNFSGTMPYYKSGSSANFSDFGAIIAKRVAAMYCGKKRIMFEKWKTNISYTDYPAITRLF